MKVILYGSHIFFPLFSLFSLFRYLWDVFQRSSELDPVCKVAPSSPEVFHVLRHGGKPFFFAPLKAGTLKLEHQSIRVYPFFPFFNINSCRFCECSQHSLQRHQDTCQFLSSIIIEFIQREKYMTGVCKSFHHCRVHST